jgi:hypothetical protein
MSCSYVLCGVDVQARDSWTWSTCLLLHTCIDHREVNRIGRGSHTVVEVLWLYSSCDIHVALMCLWSSPALQAATVFHDFIIRFPNNPVHTVNLQLSFRSSSVEYLGCK